MGGAPAAEVWINARIFGMRSGNQPYVVRPSAYGLITDSRGRLAIVHTPQGVFLPGGGIEAGETPEAAIVREALEECGLAIQLGEWRSRAVQFIYSTAEQTHFEKRCTFAAGRAERFDVCPGESDHELAWVEAGTSDIAFNHECHAWAVEQWKSSCA